MKTILFLIGFYVLATTSALADSVTLASGRVVKGLILQTNATNIVMRTDIGVFAYPLLIVKEAKSDRPEAEDFRPTARLPDERNMLLLLGKQPWASYLKQIPATVIDTGILRNVPYVSYRCGEDYEVNIYGDLSTPAGIEIGIYHGLIGDRDAQRNCLEFMGGLLGKDDRDLLQTLDRGKDMKTRDGLTLEITPPNEVDSYGGWWVSVYSEQRLNSSRASEKELEQITVSKSDPKPANSSEGGSWSAEDMKLARPYRPKFITFTSHGDTVTNAEVVRVIEGVELVWRSGASGGIVKLADLPQDLQKTFGYNPAMAAEADFAEKERLARELAQAQGGGQSPPAQAAYVQTPADDYASGATSSHSPHSSSGGRVYVQGYTKSNGTYVQPYTRSNPHRR